jgi:hypothetical protein
MRFVDVLPLTRIIREIHHNISMTFVTNKFVKQSLFSGKEKIMNFIDQQIRLAQERGEFDSLRGHGLPLKMDGPGFGTETSMAYKMVKDNGYTLGFIGERKKLLQKIAGMRVQLVREAEKNDGSIGAELRWKHSLESFRRQVTKLNRAIRNYNLKAPREQFHILTLDPEWEIERVSR